MTKKYGLIPIKIVGHTKHKHKPMPIVERVCPLYSKPSLKECGTCNQFMGFEDWNNLRCGAAR